MKCVGYQHSAKASFDMQIAVMHWPRALGLLSIGEQSHAKPSIEQSVHCNGPGILQWTDVQMLRTVTQDMIHINTKLVLHVPNP